MSPTSLAPSPSRAFLRSAVWPLVAAATSMGVSRFAPALGALLLALLIGALVANSLPVDSTHLAAQVDAAKWMLRAGIVLLGLRLPFHEIASIGWRGASIVIVTVLATFSLTKLLGKRLGLNDGLVTLIAAGFSICGAAAIAAVSDVLRARQRDVAMAIALVTIFGGAMIAIIPWSAQHIGLDPTQTATWAGASIHEVAQVAAAASFVGGNAIAIAILIKLGRVAMLAPLAWWISRTRTSSSTEPAVPWFLIGFVAMSTLRTLIPLPDPVLQTTTAATTLLLAAGMFGLGLGLRLRDLWPIPLRALGLAAIATSIAMGTSLLLIAYL